MEGSFNKKGELVLKRGAREVNQICFMSSTNKPCGEWCPQLSEPIRQQNVKLNRSETLIHICQGRHWKLTEFEDRREI